MFNINFYCESFFSGRYTCNHTVTVKRYFLTLYLIFVNTTFVYGLIARKKYRKDIICLQNFRTDILNAIPSNMLYNNLLWKENIHSPVRPL